ncbi:MAG: potassium transporter TrkG [Acidimicrobiia bacterium]|jgi:trk system potassium uptake protein TrkH
MLIRPVADDFRVIAFYLGRIFLVVAGAGLLPLIWAAAAREWDPFGSCLLMVGAFALLGVIGVRLAPREAKLDWSHGMVVVALTWLVVPVLGAIPLLLSGHFVRPLDAFFDSVSGLTTTGLSLLSDVDHLASSLNFWRHLLQFLGGQGIILAALTIFAGTGGITLYFGEARDERILPSVTSTARFIWGVSVVHLVFGVAALGLIGWLALGYDLDRSLFHGLLVFFAAFDTGGFSPMSTSVGYYHSALFEAGTSLLMVAGAMSFGLHYALWRGPRRAIFANLETRTILSTFGFTMFLTMLGLAATSVFTTASGLTRQGFFQVLSAHTGTGFATVSTAELARWGGLAFGGMAIAMALGGMGSSTAGGVKSLRIGLTVKSVINQIKQVLLPEHALVGTAYYQSGEKHLSPTLTQSVMIVSLLYVALYLLGAGIGLAYGVPLQDALFESVSASANVGLSVGVTNPSMPVLLELTYMLQMWAGRLEFVAVFSLLGFIYAWVRGR